MVQDVPPAIKAVLFDLDGVFYVGNELIPGAVEALDRTRKADLRCRFITNTTTLSSGQLLGKLADLGMSVEQEELITAPVATAAYLRQQGINRVYFAVDPAVMVDFDDFQVCEESPEAVVIGDIGESWSYKLLDRLFGYLLDGATLVAMHRNKYWQKAEGLHIDIGVFVAGLEYAAGTEAVITGKPAKAFFDAALSGLGVSADQAILVGDDIESDIGGAQRAGLKAALVRTGKYRKSLAERSDVVPDWIIDSIADIGRVLQETS